MPEPDDASIEAAEFALGLLDGEERAGAMRRLVAEPAFARDVERWRDRFGELFVRWPDAEPGPHVASRVLRIPAGDAPGAQRWRWAAGVSTLAAAALAVALVARPERVVTVPAPMVVRPAPLVAAVAPERGLPFAVLYDAPRGEVRLAGTVAVPAGKDAELWAIAGDGVPQPIGLLHADPAGRIVLVSPASLAVGTTLAISIEPDGGSPTQAPTGPVVAKGTLSAI